MESKASDRTTTILDDYKKMRERLSFDSVSLGYTEVCLFKSDELYGAQVGYRMDLSGNSLIGANAGDWQENWFVIGYEDCCGDPLFIDVDAQGYPVYTAASGEGFWNSILVAETFEKFICGLERISHLSIGRENPVLLEQNPISQDDIDTALEMIRQDNPSADMSFWEAWLENGF